MKGISFHRLHLFRNFRKDGGGNWDDFGLYVGSWQIMFCLICNDVGNANGGAVGGIREWLDSKTVENGGCAGESLCHGVGLKALGAGDGSL